MFVVFIFECKVGFLLVFFNIFFLMLFCWVIFFDLGNGILMIGEFGDFFGIDGGVGICVCGRLIFNVNVVVFNDFFSVVFLIVIFCIIFGRVFLRFFIYNGFGLWFFVFLFEWLKMYVVFLGKIGILWGIFIFLYNDGCCFFGVNRLFIEGLVGNEKVCCLVFLREIDNLLGKIVSSFFFINL